MAGQPLPGLRSLHGELWLYLLIPAAGAASPLLLLPVLSRAYGAEGWAAVAIAQSLGNAAALMAELGWSVIGPQRVARAGAGERQALYRAALASRAAALALLLPLAAVAAAVQAPAHAGAAALIAAGASLAALSPGWFLTGCNEPRALLRIETLPRIAATLAAALGIALGAPLALYGVTILGAALLTLALGAPAGAHRPRLADLRQGAALVREHRPVALGRLLAAAYTSLPVTLVSLANPGAVAVFAAVERLMRMSLTLLAALPSRLQSWVGEVADEAQRRARSRQSLRLNAALGAAAALGFAVLVPWLGPLLFARAVPLPPLPVALAAATLLIVCASRGGGLSLVAEGRSEHIAWAQLGAAAVGLLAVGTLAARWGAAGGLLGLLLSEAVGLSIQLAALRRRRPAS